MLSDWKESSTYNPDPPQYGIFNPIRPLPILFPTPQAPIVGVDLSNPIAAPPTPEIPSVPPPSTLPTSTTTPATLPPIPATLNKNDSHSHVPIILLVVLAAAGLYVLSR